MTSPSNKMASGRKLLWSHIQGGHGSHGKASPEENYVQCEMFLERFDEAPAQTFSALYRGVDLAYQVSLYPGNCQPGSQDTSRQLAAFSQWFCQKTEAASGSQPEA